MLQQALVNGAELLHSEVAIIDVAPVTAVPFERKLVDDRGKDAVRQSNLVKQRGVGRREQAAIVGRNADGSVTPINDARKISNAIPDL